MTDTAITGAHRPLRTTRVLGLSVVGALGLGGALAAPAWAHDTLVDSTPESEEVLTESPEQIVLEFSGDGLTVGDQITNDIWVLDEDHQNWAVEEPAEVDGATMSTELVEELPDGEYEVQYRVVYSDGHDEELSFSFEVDAPVEAETGAEGESGQDQAGTDDGVADAEQDESPEQEQAVEEGAVPAWALWALAGAAVVIAGLVALAVRRKLKQ